MTIPELRTHFERRVLAFREELDAEDPETDTFWERVIRRFRNPRWLATGTSGLCPDLVLEAVTRFNTEPDGVVRWHDYWAWQDEALRNMAGFIGADQDEVGFDVNATVCMSHLAQGLRVPAGSRVVVNDFEHPGGSGPWRRIDPRSGEPVYDVADVPLPLRGVTAAQVRDAILAAVTPDTAVVQLSHVDRFRGLRLPIREIVEGVRHRAPGAFVVVDAAQSVGCLRVDVRDLGCDALVTGLHKWAFAPKGTACLYVRRDRLDRLSPIYHHGAGAAPESVSSKIVRSSTVNWGLQFAAMVGIDMQRAIGVERIEGRLLALVDRFLEGVGALPGVEIFSPMSHAQRSAIATIVLEGDAQVHTRLQERAHAAGLLCYADGLPGLGPSLRVPIHVYNPRSVIDELVEVIGAVARGRG